MSARLLLVATFTLVGTLFSEESSPAVGAEHTIVRFDTQLGAMDLRLAGQRASRQLDFWCEQEWKPVAGSELHLFFEHSPELDEERSFLSVTLNHGILRSLRLEEQNRALTKVVIPLPPEMLQESNELVFAVEQPGAAGSSGSWTVIRSSSYLSIAHDRTSVAWSLSDLPEPLLLRRSYEPRKLTLLVPSDPAVTTLEATALALANLAAQVAPEPVELAFIRALSEAESPVLAVGTPRELPSLRSLGRQSALEVHDGAEGPVLVRDGSPVAASVGVLALEPGEPGRTPPLLWLTGNGADAVVKAAKGLFRANRASGNTTVLLDDEVSLSPKGRREWKRFLPPANRFTLGQAGDETPELAIANDTPARVRLQAIPDTRFLPWGHSIRLSFQTLPGLFEDPEASLQTYWNDVLLRQDPVERVATGPFFSIPVTVPAALLRADNVLTVAWSGRTGAAGPFVALQEDSEFYLPREYAADLPDLGRLKEFFYPFSLRADLSDLMIVPPEDGSDDALAALCELAALIGRLVPTEQLAFGVRRAIELPRDKSQIHFIWLETGEITEALPPLPDWSRVPGPGGERRAQLPLLMERPSPWSDEKYILRLRATSPALLRAAVRSLGAPSVLERLSGDTALMAAEGLQGFSLVARRTVAEISYLTRLEAWLRTHWLALPLILALISGVLFLGLRLALGHYRSARMTSSNTVTSRL